VVLIDEAHAMPIETLEEIRLLSNLESNRHKLLQIVLFGQPELDQHLALPNMRQLKERITHSFKLEPLVRSDVESYVDFRMRAAGYRGPNVFAPPAMKLISQSSQGLTRRINILADKSLLAAFADGTHQVTAKHARAAVRDSEFGATRLGVPNAWWFVAAGLAAGLLVGVGLHLWNQAGGMRGVAAAASQTPVETSVATTAPAPPGQGQDHVGAKASAESEPATAAVTVSSAAPSAPVAAAPPAPEPAAIATPTVPAAAAPIGARPPASGKLAQERFAATQKWLRTAPNGTWTIQLMTAGDAQTIERFLEEAGQTVQLEDVYLYGVKQNGRQYYGVTYGNYPTLEDTITAMGDLPTSFKSRGPFHRSIGVMRRQNQE
jgi:septal ring-binding cell division protein DamX